MTGLICGLPILAQARVENHWILHNILPLIALGVFGLVAAFYLLFFITSLCERQRVSGQMEPISPPFPFPPSPYWTVTRDNAIALGLKHCGDYATKKGGSLVKGLLSIFISQDRHVIVAVFAGGLAAAKLKKTVMRTRLSSGRILVSTDNAGVLWDFSGVMDSAVLVNAGIAELLNFHTQRIAQSRSTPIEMNGDATLEEYERIDFEKAQRWVLLGLARWADPQQKSYRLTWRGAFKQTSRFQKQFGDLQSQQHRSYIGRAGAGIKK